VLDAKLTFEAVESIDTPVLATWVFGSEAKPPQALLEDLLSEIDQRTGGRLKEMASTGELTGKAGETLLLHQPSGLKAGRLLLLGAGKPEKFSLADVRNLAGAAARFLKSRSLTRFTFLLRPLPAAPAQADVVQAAVEGVVLGNFEPNRYQTEEKDEKVITALCLGGVPPKEQKALEAAVQRGLVTGEAQNFARELVNEPGNRLTPRAFAERAAELTARQNVSILDTLALSYAGAGQFDKAVAACQRAYKLKPSDADLADDFKNLTAELTMARGKYDQDGDFRNSIKDREAQEKLHAQQSVVRTEDYRLLAVKEARKKLAKNPDLAMNIFNLAETLSDLQNDDAENEAVELLENAYKSKNDFSFKQRAGLLRIKQLRRKLRQAKVVAEAKADDAKAKGRVEELSKQLSDVELDHYRLCMENYPTDLKPKYEYGIRLIRNKRYDEAIPLFQEAQRDPRRKISAMDKIGFCFFMKEWFADAIDVFNQAIDSYEIKDDKIAKELRYNLARSYEEHGETEKALEVYRKIAQLDFAYKDVSERVDKLRNKPK